MPNSRMVSLKKAAVNAEPRSDIIVWGMPKFETTASTNTRAVVSAEQSGTARMIGQLLNASIKTSKAVFPFFVFLERIFCDRSVKHKKAWEELAMD